MGQTLRDRLRTLLNATHPTCETTQDPEDEPNPNLSIVVVSRSPMSHPTTHWAIAVITDERTRRCRVFQVSDVHILGLRSLGWTAFVQDEILDRSSSYRGGVRIGVVERDDLDRLEEVRCSSCGHPASLKRAFLIPVKHFTDERPGHLQHPPPPSHILHMGLLGLAARNPQAPRRPRPRPRVHAHARHVRHGQRRADEPTRQRQPARADTDRAAQLESSGLRAALAAQCWALILFVISLFTLWTHRRTIIPFCIPTVLEREREKRTD